LKFALLDLDAELLTLAGALVESGHKLLLAVQPGESEGALRALAPEIRILNDWEGILACDADAVLMGRPGDEAVRLEQLRLLAQEKVATVFLHPQTISTLAYYELDMHRQATGVRLVSCEGLRHHPALAALRASAGSDAPPPRIDQVICERRLGDRSRPAVLRQLASDLGAIRRLVGDCEKVSALGTIGDDPQAGHLGVQMTTDSGALVRWSIGPSAAGDEARWTIVTEQGPIGWTIDRHGHAVLEHGDEKVAYTAREALHATAAAVTAALDDATNFAWREALADMEVVEAVERSLRKGRTVELFHEEASEQGTFKGLMAAGGCLLLVLSIGLAIAATIVGKFRLVIANAWPFVLLVVLVAFLLLQLLRFVFPRNDAKK
jgi:hypothetical protein